PIVNANVVKAGTEEPYFTPYFIQEKSVVDNQGKTHKLA
ncbi:2',3'-cyclic-nucleotide 2'-phosphodiesterase precursor, partial [Haemophilus influenzae HK1212]